MALRSYLYGFFFLAVLSCSGPAEHAVEMERQGSFFQWLQEAPTELILHFDRDSLEAARDEETPINAILQVVRNDTINIEVELSTRGVNRKKICDFPPLRLTIPSAYVEEQNWFKPRKYKLVTDCTEGRGNMQLLFREYLAYQLQAMHLDHYLKAQLLPIIYVLGEEVLQSHVIILEPAKEMARRLDAELLDIEKEKIKHLHQESYDKLVLFQYMIGNTDWNLTRAHNVEWIRLNNGSISPIPVAYDFDGCGLVNAPYAKPYSTLPIKSTRERFLQYRGDKVNLEEERDQFSEKREEVFNLISNTKRFLGEDQKNMIEFMEAFYTDLPNITSD